MCGTHETKKMVVPRLHLHISRDAFSTFTGRLKEFLLPWRWKTAYLDKEDGSQPERVLVSYTGNSDHFRKLLGKSWFETNLIKESVYGEIHGREYLYVPAPPQWNIKTRLFGFTMGYGPYKTCHIFRARSLFSTLEYHFHKRFSFGWKEVTLQVGQASGKVLIKKKDEQTLLNLAERNLRVL